MSEDKCYVCGKTRDQAVLLMHTMGRHICTVCELERERAQVEAERMEVYEGGPLPDANFYDHDW